MEHGPHSNGLAAYIVMRARVWDRFRAQEREWLRYCLGCWRDAVLLRQNSQPLIFWDRARGRYVDENGDPYG
jgi:hypothetical protein